jgi:hypothetical protein
MSFGGSVNLAAIHADVKALVQVIQPVTMTKPQDQRTMAYLQHSIAPIAAGKPSSAGSPFDGPFPTISALPLGARDDSVFPSFYATSGVFETSRSFAPMPMPPTSYLPPPPPTPPIPTGEMKIKIAETTEVKEAPPTSYIDLQKCIAAHGSRIPLPADDTQQAEMNISFDPAVKEFLTPVTSSVLLDTFALVEYTCRRAAALRPDPSGAVSMIDVAKHLLNFFSAVNQLPGWAHVEQYIKSPAAYLTATQIVNYPDPKATPISIVGGTGVMNELMSKGNALILRLLKRIDWVLCLQPKAQKRADPEVLMRVISADRVWASDSTAFMKEAEVQVTALLTENQPKFHQFREHQRKGVQWPHSSAARKAIEAAGFVFRPMMIKRDRSICETCQAEVSGWRPWQCPWAFHDYSRHLPAFLEKARSACAANKVVMVVLDDAKARAKAAHSPAPSFSLPPAPSFSLPPASAASDPLPTIRLPSLPSSATSAAKPPPKL